MLRHGVVLALGIIIGSAGLGFAAHAQETQTPSFEIAIDLGADGQDAPYVISCEGSEFTAAEDGQGARLAVALFSEAAQTPAYALDDLIAVTAGRATLTQTPSLEVGAASAGHIHAELVDDLNGDALPDAVFYFSASDVLPLAEGCSGETSLLFELELTTSAGPVRVWGVDQAQFQAPAVVEPQEPAPAALSISQTMARPHPAGQAHGFQFLVQGAGIQAMKVEVFGLSGERVFDSDFVSARALNWNGLSSDGVRVANGVYLYLVTVRGADGSVLRGEVKKLVVLR